MEIWEDIAANAEEGSKRLVAEYGDRLFSAAVRICGNDSDADLGTLVIGGAYWISSTPLVLPDTFTIRVTANSNKSGNKTRVIFAAPAVFGSVANWTLETTGFRAKNEPELRMTSNGVELNVKMPGMMIYFK